MSTLSARMVTFQIRGIWVYLDSSMNFGQSNCQYDVHLITKLHKYDGWRTWDTNILSCACCVVVFAIVILMFLSPQVHIPHYLWTSILSKYTYMSIDSIPTCMLDNKTNLQSHICPPPFPPSTWKRSIEKMLDNPGESFANIIKKLYFALLGQLVHGHLYPNCGPLCFCQIMIILVHVNFSWPIPILSPQSICSNSKYGVNFFYINMINTGLLCNSLQQENSD